MGIRQAIAKYLLKGVEPLDDKYVNALFRNMLRAGNITEIQDNADSYIKDGYQGTADVYSIIRRYVTMSTQAKVVLRQKTKSGDIIDVEGHELNKFMFKVNPQMTMAQLREAYTVYLLTTGNSFWYKPVLDSGLNKGKTKELYVLPSNDIEIIQGDNKLTAPVDGYKLISSSVNSKFYPEEVHHVKYFNPLFYTDETLFGQSPLKAAVDILSKQIQAAKTEAKQFENQGPAYFLYRDGVESWNTMSDPQRTELEKEINNLSKKGKQGSAKVLKDKFGVINLGISTADLKIIESTQDGRRILANVYQLPVALLNDPEGSTYNNIVEARKAAWTDALIPHNDTFATHLNMFLIDCVDEYREAGYFYDMDYSGVEELQSGIKEKVDWMTRAKWTANEIREATGKDKVKDDQMDQPIFSQSDVLLDELNLDSNLEEKNNGDY